MSGGGGELMRMLKSDNCGTIDIIDYVHVVYNIYGGTDTASDCIQLEKSFQLIICHQLQLARCLTSIIDQHQAVHGTDRANPSLVPRPSHERSGYENIG